jgi:hypothetical protein
MFDRTAFPATTLGGPMSYPIHHAHSGHVVASRRLVTGAVLCVHEDNGERFSVTHAPECASAGIHDRCVPLSVRAMTDLQRLVSDEMRAALRAAILLVQAVSR